MTKTAPELWEPALGLLAHGPVHAMRAIDVQGVASDAVCEITRLRTALTAAQARIAELEAALRSVSTHREDCWAYDDDMGYERRSFIDEEEWDRVEEMAARAANEGVE